MSTVSVTYDFCYDIYAKIVRIIYVRASGTNGSYVEIGVGANVRSIARTGGENCHEWQNCEISNSGAWYNTGKINCESIYIGNPCGVTGSSLFPGCGCEEGNMYVLLYIIINITDADGDHFFYLPTMTECTSCSSC